MYNQDAEAQEKELQAWREKMDEEMRGEDPQAQAEEMLKLKTAKIRRAR